MRACAGAWVCVAGWVVGVFGRAGPWGGVAGRAPVVAAGPFWDTWLGPVGEGLASLVVGAGPVEAEVAWVGASVVVTL